jgi:hypothetical protein
MSQVSALRACGRLTVSVPTGPSVDQTTWLDGMIVREVRYLFPFASAARDALSMLRIA